MRRKNQKSTALLISWIIGITYIIYIMTYFCIVYFYKAEIAYCWDDTISSHILLAAAGIAFGIVEWAKGERKFLFFRIVFTANAMILFPLYAIFGSLEIIFALIGSRSLRQKPAFHIKTSKKDDRKWNRLLSAAMIVPVLFSLGGCTMDNPQEMPTKRNTV